MTILRSESFLRDFRSLPEDVRRKVEATLRLLLTDPRHPSLRVHKMEPKALGIFEVRVTKNYRLTFDTRPDQIRLRCVGTHNILRTP
jgi:mRNA-degrading endonuclease RelE of RelBE toxin-antitoxin system